MKHLLWIGLIFMGVLIWVRIKTGKAPRRVIRDHLREGALVLDVRTEEEFATDHFDESVNIPLDLLHARLDRLGDNKRRPVILYCHSGVRSSSAAIILIKAGFHHVHNAGSLADIRHAAESHNAHASA